MAAEILVTGSQQGYGAFLTRQLLATGLHRGNAADIFLERRPYDIIYHCAFSSSRQKTETPENIHLLESLLQLPHRRFVFISSCDVYPDNENLHPEEESLDPAQARSPYARDKIRCENLILRKARSPLVIRPTSLLGSAPTGNLRNLLNDSTPQLTLTPDSRWNFLGYNELLHLLTGTHFDNYEGVLNLARTAPVEVREIAAAIGKTPAYGSYRYRVPFLDNRKALAVLPALSISSLQFIRSWREKNP